MMADMIVWATLQNMVPIPYFAVPLVFPVPLFINRLSSASINYLNWSSLVFGRFQNGFNKVVIELSGVQFWSEIILVISNRTCTARSFDFEITRMISDQIALHSVQLP